MKMDNFFKVALGVGAAIMPTISQAVSFISTSAAMTSASAVVAATSNSVVASEGLNAVGHTLSNFHLAIATLGGLTGISVIGFFVHAINKMDRELDGIKNKAPNESQYISMFEEDGKLKDLKTSLVDRLNNFEENLKSKDNVVNVGNKP